MKHQPPRRVGLGHKESSIADLVEMRPVGTLLRRQINFGVLPSKARTYGGGALANRRCCTQETNKDSKFIHSDTLTIKLEGAELVGYQTIMIAGVREPQHPAPA